MAITYKDAGVDIDKGDAFVERIKSHIKSTYNAQVVTGVGGFAALYDLGDDRYLAAGTDGVGTKLKLAIDLDNHDTIGIDLVAMCANDLICTGARPMFFLDYLATGKLELETSEAIVKGIVDGCKQSKAALIGGETAEMPGMYADGHYDLAGFCVGEVKKSELLDGSRLSEGDTLIALGSSGFHSNGYSLVRALLKDDETQLKQKCLTPTRIYVNTITSILSSFGDKITGVANITGGGLHNIPRINPDMGYDITLLPEYQDIPEEIGILAKRSELSKQELYKTFNMGIGMVVATNDPQAVEAALNELGENTFVIGHVTSDFTGINF
jgi:phosphoribosylformylglycinamidine cyclo-ligase